MEHNFSPFIHTSSGYALELVALVGLAKSLEILRDPR